MPRPLNAWIRRRIFPGGYTPTLAEVTSEILAPGRHVGGRRREPAAALRPHAGPLERAVRGRRRSRPAIQGEEFYRAWELYLAGSEAAFRTGWMQLFQIVFAPNGSAPPFFTRAPLYQRAHGTMIRCDAIVVGGGPAGSSCARTLRLAGWQVVVVDRARFPRDKVCAGWLTPDVFPLLDLDPAAYRATVAPCRRSPGSAPGDRRRPVETRYPRTVSYAIRRCEFDDFLLRRATCGHRRRPGVVHPPHRGHAGV